MKERKRQKGKSGKVKSKKHVEARYTAASRNRPIIAYKWLLTIPKWLLTIPVTILNNFGKILMSLYFVNWLYIIAMIMTVNG